MGLDRLRAMFAATRGEGRAAFLPYLTAGLPSPADSLALFEAMAAAGADGFEVGIPYSDPLMDGPVIQQGSERALAAGTTLDIGLVLTGRIAAGTGLPTLAMTYANPVFRRGVDVFCGALAESGADGIIVPDLPVDEAGPVLRAAQRHGLGTVLFVAPTSDDSRIRLVAAADPVFIYAVAEMGVTGERGEASSHVVSLAERIRAVTDAPIVFGVGISTPEQAKAAAEVGDGIIVGTALVRRVLESSDPSDAASKLAAAVSEIAAALRN
ncbi:MAG TPA: tryptophan synthase subunit alpha [Acidimicrobiia bacterium]|nr:tryptophan synthase subunit alpha [Acidimicrobiia bacterium]